MDYRILFTQTALDDFSGIVEYISEDDAEAAERFGNSLLDHIELLARFPSLGVALLKRPRVKKLAHSPVAVYYQVSSERRIIEVPHIRPEARRPPRFALNN